MHQLLPRPKRVARPAPLEAGVFCVVLYVVCRTLCTACAQGLLNAFCAGPGVAARPAVWDAVRWALSFALGAAGLLAPAALSCRLFGLSAQQVRLAAAPRGALRRALPLYLAAAQLAVLLPASDSAAQTALPRGTLPLLLAWLALCAAPALLEELMFRGVMLGVMQPAGLAAAVAGQAVLFALLHTGRREIFFALFSGLVFGALAARTGSLVPGMVLHLCNNTLAFVLLWLRGAAFEGLAVFACAAGGAGFLLWGVIALAAALRRGELRLSLLPRGGLKPLFCSPAFLLTVLVLAANAVIDA